MQVTTKHVTKVHITDVMEEVRLDPITAILEDLGPAQGKIIIECYGESWANYWGGMGQDNIAQFFCGCDEQYLAGCLSNIRETVPDLDALRAAGEAHGLHTDHDDPRFDVDFMAALSAADPRDWWSYPAEKPNPPYQYLCRIIKAVQQALRSLGLHEKQEAARASA